MRIACLLMVCLFGVAGTKAQNVEVHLQTKGAAIQSTMYGVFFEDINFAADGGLYAELVKNRSFEFDNPLMGWEAFGNVSILTQKPCFPNNPHFARLSFSNELSGSGFENSGFRGMGILQNEQYNVYFYARNVISVSDTVKLKIELLTSDNTVIQSKVVSIFGTDWRKYETSLASWQTTKQGRLRISLVNKGVLDIDHISMFPQNTYKKRKNGLRNDLAQALETMKPGIFRFPGGCIVEGSTLATRYQWKNTIGPVENRPTIINRWNYTFGHRRFPDYYQSFGLGFYEYFLLSEDIGAAPLPVINCGLSCQFENFDDKQHCAPENLQPYIDDALDLIEFANGSTATKWGKIRADMGHPAPFNLKFLAVGNEQWKEPYAKRLPLFIKAIREKYPNINIIGSSGPGPEGDKFEYGWTEMKKNAVDLVDEHFYKSPEWFLKNVNRYDQYSRQGPKVFAGEYACHVSNRSNNLESALCEAALMTGFERNADVVHMTAYAPLFAHVDNWQWKPDLIWFDNVQMVKTPNYYVQALFAQNKGDYVIPFLNSTNPSQPIAGQDSLYASAVVDSANHTIILKIVNVGNVNKDIQCTLIGYTSTAHMPEITQTELRAEHRNWVNSIDKPNEVVPRQYKLMMEKNQLKIKLKKSSFNMIKIVLQ